MSFADWSLLLGLLLLTMVLSGTLRERLPVSSAMVYLALGWLLGPQVLDVLRPDPWQYAGLLEGVSEAALLISLFAVGLRLGIPLRDRRWRLPVRLALVSMVAMVTGVALVGVYALHLPWGAAILLGAILAPTDPVLASSLPSDDDTRTPDRLGFSLAGEGGLNDGTAFPFVMLGLGLLGLRELGPGWLQWWGVDLLWATLGGLLIGALLGRAVGGLVVHLRSRHGEAVGLDEFLGLGVIGVVYGIAQLSQASGFMAVFAAGLALQRVRERPRAHTRPLGAADDASGHAYDVLATHSHHASATMRDSIQSFNIGLERLLELGLVLLVGALLAYAKPLPLLLWFVPLVLLVLRPLAVATALWGERLSCSQAALLAWFGIRGVGSVFYLMLALHLGVRGVLAELLLSLVLWTVATSVVVHGLTAQPLMRRYNRSDAGS